MEQLSFVRPFGTEGLDVRLRFAQPWWKWELYELADGWRLWDMGAARSSDRALAQVLQSLCEYREACAQAMRD